VRGVKAIQPNAAVCEFIKIRCLEFGVTIVAGVAQALIVRHDEDDVGFVSG
jgi:hypothetical protein